MKVIEHLEMGKGPRFSYEIVPPPRGRSVSDIINVVEDLAPFSPPWIDVTSHSAGAVYLEHADGTVQKRVFKKRPGTIGICGIIQNRFKIDTVTHLLCEGFTQEETEDALIELSFLGIHNVLALRGDSLNYKKPVAQGRKINKYALHLVEQIHRIKDGIYLDELDNAASLDFCVGVAGYPEKHFEAPCLKVDIENLKKKIDAGADYVITQMCFDNQAFFEFYRVCRDIGIRVPIIPGLKVLQKESQLTTVPRNFHVDFPDALIEEVRSSPTHIAEIGVNWAIGQTRELLEFGVPCVHFYVMNDVKAVKRVVGTFVNEKAHGEKQGHAPKTPRTETAVQNSVS
jgi:methylenetetrahydrofolate reductase (NADPH)